ncbi:MAG: hypothetical protein AB7R00_02470 [Kofleriaceae bacterium]
MRNTVWISIASGCACGLAFVAACKTKEVASQPADNVPAPVVTSIDGGVPVSGTAPIAVASDAGVSDAGAPLGDASVRDAGTPLRDAGVRRSDAGR